MDERIMKGTGKLGFGLMRLPHKGLSIDIEQTSKMVDMFIEGGGTYFDTAYVYQGSEAAAKKALVERHPRESYTLATKLNASMLAVSATEKMAKKQFETSLERTGAGYFDYYLLHALDSKNYQRYEKFGIWDFAKEKKAQGLIRHMGFSFHGRPELLDKLLTEHPEAEFVQLQINYADWENPMVQSRACYEVARKHGKPVIIMEPVKGGMLANPPDPVKAVFKEAEPENSCASWALRFCADLEGVITALSGMSNVEQMQDNLNIMKNFRGLTEEQRLVLARAREELEKIPVIPCTSCQYCAKVCPNNIGISGSFEAMNLVILYEDPEFGKNKMKWSVDAHGKKRATECIGCGACEEACPQHIAIVEELKKVAQTLC